jgi:Phage integrase family
MRGVDLKTVQELMGHKHINMTLRYVHLAAGHKRAAIAVLDQSANEVPSIFPTVGQEASSTLPQALENQQRRRIGAGVPPGLQIQ